MEGALIVGVGVISLFLQMKITKITVTGADDSVSPQDLCELSRRFPIVEFGILLSRKSQGSTRFPSAEWLSSFMHEAGEVQCSGHICGSWVREILMGQWPTDELSELLGDKFFERFGRWQLNTHGMRHEWSESFIRSLSRGPTMNDGPRGVIFQFDEKNNAVVEAAMEAGQRNIAALFDLSHGAGTLPSEWPSLIHGIECGYAGGLSPANVSEQCRRIQGVVGNASIWIDAETHLRSGNDRYFDLSKVEQFITNALPYA